MRWPRETPRDSGHGVSPRVSNPTEHDLDAIAPLVSVLVVLHLHRALLSARDTGAYPIVCQCVAEPVGVIAAISEQPVDLG